MQSPREWEEEREPLDFERERKEERENLCFSLYCPVSSKVQSHFVYGLIDMKFGGEVCDSLVFNMNRGDYILSFGR